MGLLPGDKLSRRVAKYPMLWLLLAHAQHSSRISPIKGPEHEVGR
jgi:hypothetical protein